MILRGLSRRAQARLLEVPSAYQVIRLDRASRAVRDTPGFIRAEFLEPGRTATYDLRAAPTRVVLEHRSSDVDVLGQVFTSTEYRPPEAIARWMDALAEHHILDLGANIGLFSLLACARWRPASVSAFEPDARNLERLQDNLELNGFTDRVTPVAACAGARSGEVSFSDGHGWTSRIAVGVEDDGRRVAVRDVFPLLDGITLLKMDIEGGEWEILTDGRWPSIRVPVLVLEYHRHLCPHIDPRGACVEALWAAGYAPFERPHASAEQDTLWAIRRDLVTSA